MSANLQKGLIMLMKMNKNMNTPINEEVVSTAIFGEDIEGDNAKNSALFPLKHLFSIVDGRLSTSISDIQSIFGVYCGRSVFTHQLPELIDEVKSAKPDWYMQAKGVIEYIKWRKHTDDFVKLMDILDKDFSNVYIMVEEKL